MREYYDILVRPLVNEKSSAFREKNVYFFEVALDANKIEIRHAVETAFNLKNKVMGVRTINVKGKPKRFGRYKGKRSDWKKAMVTLARNSVIEALGDS
jgi:large subunit ribosomal protein L23